MIENKECLNEEARENKTIQYKLVPLPSESNFWLLHLQIGQEGTKENKDYCSSSLVVSQIVALALLRKGLTNSCSFRPKSMQGYTVPGDLTVPEFEIHMPNNSPEAVCLTFRDLCDHTEQGTVEENWTKLNEAAQKEVAVQFSKKMSTDILMHVEMDDEMAH